MSRGQCLCGQVSWDADGRFEWMSHCHCSRCRKTHGSAFATYVAAPAAGFRLRGSEHVGRWQSSPGMGRSFCTACGAVVPMDAMDGRVFIPAGNFDDDPGVRPVAHIFVGSKAPWFTISDDLAQFDAYPEGIDAPVLPDRPPLDPPGAPRGSCACGAVGYRLEGVPARAFYCHCGRCRRARSAAYASNLVIAADGVRFTRGADRLVTYKLPAAQHFAQVFCRTCSAPMPRIDPARGLAIVPMGGLDDDPGIQPQAHIFAASKAVWDVIAGDLPHYAEYPA